MLTISADKPIISKDAALAILDRIDKMRRNKIMRAHNRGYEDYCIRLACAIVADAGGFESRASWEEALRVAPDSLFAKDYNNPEYRAELVEKSFSAVKWDVDEDFKASAQDC